MMVWNTARAKNKSIPGGSFLIGTIHDGKVRRFSDDCTLYPAERLPKSLAAFMRILEAGGKSPDVVIPNQSESSHELHVYAATEQEAVETMSLSGWSAIEKMPPLPPEHHGLGRSGAAAWRPLKGGWEKLASYEMRQKVRET